MASVALVERPGRPLSRARPSATTRSSSSPPGSIRFGLPDTDTVVDLGVGDRLDLPAGTSHDAHVGPDGVTCLEAHAPAGTLAAVLRRAAGEW